MNRRSLLLASAAAVAVGTSRTPAGEAAGPQQPDGLNPPGIRTAGIRMVAVVGGKYKVWTKRMGSGAV